MTKLKHDGRGGRREGSGRKRLGRRQVMCMIDEELIARIDALSKNRSQFLNEAIRCYLNHLGEAL